MDVLLGIILGGISGLFFGALLPGVHQNSLAIILSPFGPLGMVAGLVSQAFGNVLPSVALGASGEISALPGKRLFSKGEGIRAILISLESLALSFGIFLLFLPALLILLPRELPKGAGLAVLSFFSAFLIFSEREKLESFVFFSLAGILGLLFVSEDSLFPAFSGFFGGASLLGAILFRSPGGTGLGKGGFGKAKNSWPEIGKLILPCFFGVVSGFFVGTFPALTVSVVSAVLIGFLKDGDDESFLALSVSGGFSSFLFSLSSFSLLGVKRSGSISSLAAAGLSGAVFPDAIVVALAVSAVSLLAISRALPMLSASFSDGGKGMGSLEILSFLILSGMVGFLSGIRGLLLFSLATAISLLSERFSVGKRVFVAFIIFPAFRALVW